MLTAARTSRNLATLTLVLVLTCAALGMGTRPGLAAAPPDREDQLRFMWAMAGQESGWDYYARNASSGAFGKYQIMPFNWPAWSEKYLGDRHADQTPFNQEKVAFGKLRDLYTWLGSWKRVAYWWLTGSSEKDPRKWSPYAKGYVANIMQLRKRAPSHFVMPPRTSSRAAAGSWRRSGEQQRLRLAPGGKAWPERGLLRDGQVLQVKGGRRGAGGARWVKVVTADGRLGWLKQARTVPTHKPRMPARWRDVRDDGRAVDRGQVRPRPV